MYKVIIIDDEQIIRDGLKTLIDWKLFGFEISDTASQGEEGFKKIATQKFDLAIVDIKMPLVGGLNMIDKLNNANIFCHYILLTAYSDFKSAQQAIELGVYAYLLKPISKKELIDKLLAVKQEILNNKKTNEKLALYNSYEKNNFLNKLIFSNQHIDVSKINSIYKFQFPWESYCIALIYIQTKISLTLVFMEELSNTIKLFFKDINNVQVFYSPNNCGILFDNSTNDLTSRFYHLKEVLNKKYSVCVLICIGRKVYDINEVSLSYKSANSIIENKFLYEYKSIIFNDEKIIADNKIERPDILNFTSLLFEAIKSGHIIIINNLLEKLKEYFKQSKQSNENIIKITYIDIYSNLTHNIISELNLYPDFILNRDEIINTIENKSTLQELHGYFKYIISSFTNELMSSSNDINSILNYINNHYNENLKLDKLAHRFGYNSIYLGKLIKKNTSYNFNTYIDILRIEHSKKLLNEGMKVFEVSETVGFCDTDYFTKKFKKYVGVTPSLYKTKISI